MFGPFNESIKLQTIVCFHNFLSIQMVVNSSILLILNRLREVSSIIGLFIGQQVGWILRLIVKIEPGLVRVLLQQEVVVQLSFQVSQEHINGSLEFRFNKVL